MNLTTAVSGITEIPGAGREVYVRVEEECVWCVWGLSFSKVLVKGFSLLMHCLCRLGWPASHS